MAELIQHLRSRRETKATEELIESAPSLGPHEAPLCFHCRRRDQGYVFVTRSIFWICDGCVQKAGGR